VIEEIGYGSAGEARHRDQYNMVQCSQIKFSISFEQSVALEAKRMSPQSIRNSDVNMNTLRANGQRDALSVAESARNRVFSHKIEI
jgi:hypothetical protein